MEITKIRAEVEPARGYHLAHDGNKKGSITARELDKYIGKNIIIQIISVEKVTDIPVQGVTITETPKTQAGGN